MTIRDETGCAGYSNAWMPNRTTTDEDGGLQGDQADGEGAERHHPATGQSVRP